MENYTVDASKKWDYENGFYLTCETSRIGKLLNHLEIYNKILELPGDIRGDCLVQAMHQGNE